jgi:SAM-dependent methyltransferase
MIEIAAAEAYRLWSASYDDELNPLLALEMRTLRERLNLIPGNRFLDVAAGTGRWAAYAQSQGVRTIGFDLSPEMLARAVGKPTLRGRMAVADMRAIPIKDGSVDLAVCSFAIGYVESVRTTLAELARVARRVVVTELHPLAVVAGWSRSFRSGSKVYRIQSYPHSSDSIERAARDAGLVKEWELEARFGAPEKQIFRKAGRDEQFFKVQFIPAVYARCWRRQ